MQRWLDELSELANSGDVKIAHSIKNAIESAPEAEVDDSNVPDYMAMRALSVLCYAAQTWAEEDSVKYAQWSAGEAADLMRDIAFTVGSSAPPLEELEITAQRDLLAQLDAASDMSASALLRIAHEAPVVRSSGTAAMEYARVRGWIS